MSVYLDYNASTPVDERVLKAMTDVYRNNFGNADSRTHEFGDGARRIVESARQSAAELLGVNKDEIFFTSGATESDNISILGLAEYAEKTGKKHIITTAIEHKAVLEPLEYLKKKGFEITYIKPDISGRISADELLSKVRDDTLLVSVMHVNNETGIIQPVREIGSELSKPGVLFHIDAAQSFGKLVDELRETKYDMLSAGAHKMYGPQGIGVLVLRRKRYKLPPVKPIFFGGGQEHGIRPGTLPTALIAGLGKACDIAAAEYSRNAEKYRVIKEKLISMLEASGVKYVLNGDPAHCVPNTLNISFIGVNSEALMLSSKRFCGISNGSACDSSSYSSSRVLSAMGLDEKRINSAVRISWGVDEDIFDAFQSMLDIAKGL